LKHFLFTTAEIADWYRSKQQLPLAAGVSLVKITEGPESLKPAAVADFKGPDRLGQITGWVSGEFDFHVLRASDGKDTLWRHIEVSEVDQLEKTYAEFMRHLAAHATAEW
jgi:hypothetical protein